MKHLGPRAMMDSKLLLKTTNGLDVAGSALKHSIRKASRRIQALPYLHELTLLQRDRRVEFLQYIGCSILFLH